MATIAVFGTLDTKGAVHQFLADFIQKKGHGVLLLDASLQPGKGIAADFSRATVLARAGVELPGNLDRTKTAAAMGGAVGVVLRQLVAEKRVDAVISTGGRMGMRMAAEAIRGLPMGVPCVLATHAPEEIAEVLVAQKEVTVVKCPLKPAALNRLVRPFLARAAGAVCGMVEFGAVAKWMANKPLLLASRPEDCTTGFERARLLLERSGYDVVIFAGGRRGGHPLESAIASGTASGVLDLSLSDLALEFAGDSQSETAAVRLETSGRRGVPSVVAPTGLDAVRLKGPVPVKYQHRASVEAGAGEVLVRTSVDECREAGRRLAFKLNRYLGPVTVCLPLRGLSALSGPGGPLQNPEADRALFEGLESHIRKGVRVLRIMAASGETPFAEACARALLLNIKRQERDLKMLREVVFFKNAPELALREAARVLEPLSFQAQEWVQPTSGEPGGLYLVLEGRLEVLEDDEVVELIGPGERYGELELIFGRTRPVQLRALEDCEILFLGPDTFEQLTVQHPELDERLEVFMKNKLWL